MPQSESERIQEIELASLLNDVRVSSSTIKAAEVLNKINQMLREARLDEQRRTSPQLIRTGHLVEASIIVAVGAYEVVTQADRIAALSKPKGGES